MIDDFLPPDILELCLADFPDKLGTGVDYHRDQERLKSQFNPDKLTDRTRTLFYSFNSQPFIHVLENITGIKGLVPDTLFPWRRLPPDRPREGTCRSTTPTSTITSRWTWSGASTC